MVKMNKDSFVDCLNCIFGGMNYECLFYQAKSLLQRLEKFEINEEKREFVLKRSVVPSY